jgi:hypothetical protein
MDDFFELASSRDLLDSNGPKNIGHLRKADLLDFAVEAAFSGLSKTNAEPSDFDFSANGSLSGASSSCVMIDCRVQRADDMARFAALYADHVVIRNPFANYTPRNRVEYLRREIAGDIAVMARLKPLIRKGIVIVAPPVVALCAECSRHFKREQTRIFSALEGAGDELLSRFMPRLSVGRHDSGCIGVSGPDELVAHGQQFFYPGKESVFRGRLTRARRESLVRDFLIGPLIEDVYAHLLHSRHGGFNYLTDRELDLTVIRELGGPDVRSIQKALVTGLSHSVPVIKNASIQTLVELREKEGEAFAVYREAVAAVLREADLTSPATIREAFADRIRPELANIDMAASSAKKLSRRSLFREIGVDTAAISIGMMLGSVKPTLGAVLAALGGLSALQTVAQKVTDIANEPPIARANSFYFLWKVRNASRGLRGHPSDQHHGSAATAA